MKAVFVHLSGPRRGEVQELEKTHILLGSAPDCDVRVEGAVSAEVYFENCEFYVRANAHVAPAFVNRHEIGEVILQDDDVIELGAGGPKLRFRAVYAEGEVCKPIRIVYRDSVRKSFRFRQPGVPSIVTFFVQFARALTRETTPAARLATAVLLVVAAGSLVLSFLAVTRETSTRTGLEREIVQLKTQLARAASSREELAREIADERRKTAIADARQKEETEKKLAALRTDAGLLSGELKSAKERVETREEDLESLRQRLGTTTRRIADLERAPSLRMERIIKERQAGVAFLQGEYRFEDASGALLRYMVDEKGGPKKDLQGRSLYTTSGTGGVVKLTYSGTGFLVSRSGFLLTNRHVAEPWWHDADAKEMALHGYKARLIALCAFFPSIPDPMPVEVVRVSTKADVALGKVELGARRVPALDVDRAGSKVATGQPVVVLGYPSGLDAVLARLEDDDVEAVLSDAGTDDAKIARELSRRGMIRPLATQGHLGDVLPNELVYDAQTTHGGSGGPVLDAGGKVIGINAAILEGFGGANFGVPISFGLKLLPD
jgi:S1-C subfamily serine protease